MNNINYTDYLSDSEKKALENVNNLSNVEIHKGDSLEPFKTE